MKFDFLRIFCKGRQTFSIYNDVSQGRSSFFHEFNVHSLSHTRQTGYIATKRRDDFFMGKGILY